MESSNRPVEPPAGPESPSLKPVRPVAPVAPYLGGKRHLAERLGDLIGEVPHDTYAEPFIGMGGVFFRRKSRPRCEVINDISRDVINLFRILNHHYPQFMDVLKYQITSRDEFERLAGQNPDSLTDMQRAARFLYLQRTAFGGKIVGRTFGIAPGTAGRFDVNRLAPDLAEVHERLSGVIIERLPWADLVSRWDRPGTLFYCDPPYWNCETDYGAGVFGKDDFERLAQVLAGISGRFILSINDAPEIRSIFAAFHCSVIETTYSIAEAASQKVNELVFTNIDPAVRRQASLL
ncbi:DNA adenine methylase [Ferrovibrio xuzhouensis]|uniref:site-specific DNA-methyltransferase (adenine-specific) n=1 Tax=Ferrovibrio xuzhouensis TaxID=1576914 RepID=A0ABV7VCG8_9PROT